MKQFYLQAARYRKKTISKIYTYYSFKIAANLYLTFLYTLDIRCFSGGVCKEGAQNLF